MREFIPVKDFKNEEILSGLEWYFKSKSFHLEAILSFRAPLNQGDDIKLRMHYSNYLVALLSALELLHDKGYKYNQEFSTYFSAQFVFPNFGSGEQNYSYLRELRNSIIHRGYDVTCFHISDELDPTFLHYILPKTVPNKSGSKEYPAFEKTVLGMIFLVEQIIPDIILTHVKKVDLMVPTYSKDEKIEMSIKVIIENELVPEYVKNSMR